MNDEPEQVFSKIVFKEPDRGIFDKAFELCG